MSRADGRIESKNYMQDPFSAKGSVTADIYRRRHVMLAGDACMCCEHPATAKLYPRPVEHPVRHRYAKPVRKDHVCPIRTAGSSITSSSPPDR
jgi:hypothetical protein